MTNTKSRWAGEPALAEGRVFLYSGEVNFQFYIFFIWLFEFKHFSKVHLIPVCHTPGDVTPFPIGAPNPFALARFIATYPHLTRAGPQVQKVDNVHQSFFPKKIPKKALFRVSLISYLKNK